MRPCQTMAKVASSDETELFGCRVVTVCTAGRYDGRTAPEKPVVAVHYVVFLQWRPGITPLLSEWRPFFTVEAGHYAVAL